MPNILLATDEMEIMQTAEGALEAAGWRVTTVTDGQDAYEAALSDPPDAVVCDATLPIFDGIEVCALLRQHPDIAPAMPFILITGTGVNSRAAESAGVTATLTKGFAAFQLTETLINHLPASAF